MRRFTALPLVVAFSLAGGGAAHAAAFSPGDHVSYVSAGTQRSGVLLVQTPALDLVARDGTTSTQDQVAPAVVHPFASPTPTPTPAPTPTGSDPVVTAAGDIAGGDAGTHDTATGDVIRSINPDVALTLGDNDYGDGTLSAYQKEYGPAWGSFKARTRPAAGNHDYETGNANGLVDYFNGAGVRNGPAGDRTKGVYYSFNLGSWHLIALDNYVSMASGSPQETWLRRDLAAHPGRCTLAYWHEPRFTSGSIHAPNTATQPLWNDLYAAHADIVLNGHNHQYERFALQNPSGRADPNGLREFVVGTGGQGQYSFDATLAANSQVHQTGTWGVLRLTLHPGGYDWRFVPIAGQTWTDSGSQACHASGGAATPPPTGTPSYAVRGMYDRNSSGGFADIAATGFDLIDSGPGTVDGLTAGLKGLTWVGDYDNSTCSWQVSDATLRSEVQAHARDPKVGVWFISDEPDPHACPHA
jgi:Calcineurin-like phosphoesterase